ncbi:MAG TPA: multicopper oxidase domain-containing protein [Ktedonobacterales bacterium]|nr:multicopper oxidase domain-containing protein [Ktedonobacterales bacterium]
MAIDKNARIDIGENTGATATTTIASAATADVQRPSYIQTWPLTTADLTDGAPAGPTTEQQAGVEGKPGREPEIVIPAVVKQWPVWMQRQWRQTQERRLWETTHKPRLVTRIFTPLGTLALCGMLIVALLGFGIGASVHASGSSGGSAGGSQTASGSSGGMSGMGSGSSSSASTANVPDATQQYGNQPAKFVIDPDGVKHFTMTAQQVMWQPVKGQKVLAWTLDGTVPGPVIHVTAGDHIRITIINHLPEPTTIHWHGLEVPTDNDGVPPIGMKPIQPGQSYTYDFTLNDQDAGTHWYHSHFDDLKQVGGGMYGAFLVDPRPGSPEYQPMQPMLSAQVDQLMLVGMLDGYYVINGKSFPDTQPIVVKHGQTVHIRMIGVDAQLIHPMHLHGHTFQIVAEDGHMLAAPISKDTVQLAPGETYDLTFYAWATPGSIYPLHCHILSHLMNPGQPSGEMGGLVTLVEYQK